MGKKDSIHERLDLLMKRKGINKNQLANKLGLGSSYIGNMLKGSDFGISKLIAIAELFPDVSTDWLLKGEGEMIQEGKGNGVIDRLREQIKELEGKLEDRSTEKLLNYIGKLEKENERHEKGWATLEKELKSKNMSIDDLITPKARFFFQRS